MLLPKKVDEIPALWPVVESTMRRDWRAFYRKNRAEVVRLVVDGGQSISEVVVASDFSTSMVASWVQKAGAEAS